MGALVKLADDWLQLTRVELEVNTDNPAAIRLYEKFGFVIEGTHKLHAYGDGRMAESHFMARLH
jgi:putative acetyltransferase